VRAIAAAASRQPNTKKRADDRRPRLRLEIKRRLVKKIAGHIRHFAPSTNGEPIWLVAHKEINRPILDELPAAVHRRVEKTIPRDLVKAAPRELIRALNLGAPGGCGLPITAGISSR
jgi:hypothetical protein